MIIACFKVFNEVDYIKPSVDAILPFVDKVIIADCCFGAMEKIVHSSRIRTDGLSGDGTHNVLNLMIDPKIERWNIGYLRGDQTIMYNNFVAHASIGDYIWLIDADEVYDQETAEILRDWMLSEKYHSFWLPSIVYWHDFYHTRPDHGTKSHQRIYMKLDNSAHYDTRNLAVRWRDAEDNIYGYGMPPKTTLYKNKEYEVFVGTLAPGPNQMFYHHYAYVRSEQRMLEKVVSQYLQNEAPLRAEEWEHCQQFRDPCEFKILTHPWFTNEHYEEVRQEFYPHHPLRDHTWGKYRWNEQPIKITYRRARSYLSSNLDFDDSAKQVIYG